MAQPYPRNSRVTVAIIGAIPSGLLGQVDGHRAIVRTREISWAEPLPAAHYIGQALPAIVLGYNPLYEEIELSLRLAEYDPWQEAAATFTFGTEVEGRVVGLRKDSAFIEVKRGIVGFLHASELLPQPVERISDWLWLDDLVKAMILEFDPEKRRLRLSLKELLARREARFNDELYVRYQSAATEPLLATVLPKSLRRQLAALESPSDEAETVAPLNVLAVDDDGSYGAALAGLLKRNGCTVVWAKDGMSALAEVHKRPQPFDLIVIDWGLPDLRGHQLVQLLQDEGCPSRLVMVLEPAPVAGNNGVWQQIAEAGVDVLVKSNEEECEGGLLAILDELRRKSPQRAHVADTSSYRTSLAATEQVDHTDPTISLGGSITSILARVTHDTEATSALLLRAEAGQQRIISEGFVGEPLPVEQATPEIMHSPLGEVLLKRQDVCEDPAPGSHRFDRLLTLRPFDSFIGIPVPAGEDASHGLVLLKKEGHFSRSDQEVARLAAYLLGQAIAGEQIAQALQPWQAQHLAGQLAASAIHEINNKLAASKLQIEALQSAVKTLRRRPDKASDEAFLDDMQDSVDRMLQASQQVAQLRDRYLGLTVSDEPQLVDVNRIADDIVQLVRTEARHAGVLLISRFTPDLPQVRARPSQMRQILLNLMLNAIQQTAQLGRPGRLIVETRHVAGADRPVQVRVTDEGPGIHRQWWERVFHFGFTTRKAGAGLGLTISRQTAAALGGTLEVESSYILWGTTFCLALPKGE